MVEFAKAIGREVGAAVFERAIVGIIRSRAVETGDPRPHVGVRVLQLAWPDPVVGALRLSETRVPRSIPP